MSDTVKFYGNPICPFAHRAWWAAKEKDVPIEFVNIPLGSEKPEWFTQTVNPRGTVPAIQVGPQTILESVRSITLLQDHTNHMIISLQAIQMIISEFLEDHYPDQGTPLLPKDAFQRAAIRLFIDQFGQAITVMYGLLKNQDKSKDEELKAQLTAKLKAAVDLLKNQSDGPFFLGSQLSLADIAALPFIDRFSATLLHYRDYNLFEVDDRLQQWYAAAKERKAFQETAKDGAFYIDGYKDYAIPKQ